MRWMWIDRIVHYEPGHRMTAVKNVSLSEEHIHDHAMEDESGRRVPVMPASLIIEGMAQTAGVLVGAANEFREKVVLAKIVVAELTSDVLPGQCLRYEATIDRLDTSGASTSGVVSCIDHRDGVWHTIGRIDLLFSHLDRNVSGMTFPETNFVFGENFRTLLDSAGLTALLEKNAGRKSVG